MHNKTLLWLDDCRSPFDTETDWKPFFPVPDVEYITWVRTYDAFCEFIKEEGIPYAVCLDHDLGEESNGYDGKDAANFLVEYCINHHKPIPFFNSQSSNPCGRENILKYLEQAKEYVG